MRFVSCETRRYSEISELGAATYLKTPSGKLVANPNIFIRYKDGTLWEPFLLQGEAIKQAEVIVLLRGKTALTFKIEDVFPEK